MNLGPKKTTILQFRDFYAKNGQSGNTVAVFCHFGSFGIFENIINQIFDPNYLLDDLKSEKSLVVSVLRIS